jgi:hypothetical protein
MRRTTSQDAATLLDILVDGFEKNEVFGGFHRRELPMPDESTAARKSMRWRRRGGAGRGRRCNGRKMRRGGSRRGPIWRFARRGMV